MKRQSSPWRILILTFLLCLLGGGLMEYMRYEQKAINAELDKQVKEADAKAAALRNREKKLKETKAFRNEIEPRLLRETEGQVQAQILMAVVRAARQSGATTLPISFGSGQKNQARSSEGGISRSISFQVNGSEAQLLRFIGLLEEGKPLSHIGTITWNLPFERGQDPYAAGGNASLQITVYSDPAKPAAPKKP